MVIKKWNEFYKRKKKVKKAAELVLSLYVHWNRGRT